MSSTLLTSFMALTLTLLCSCRATIKAEVEDTPLGSGSVEGEVELGSASPCDGTGESMGRGTLTLEDGTEVKGEAFDLDEDGKVDKFKPDKGQKDPDGKYDGSTSGSDWYDFKQD